MTRDWWGVVYSAVWTLGCAALSAYTCDPNHTLGYWESCTAGLAAFVALDKGLLWITGRGVLPRDTQDLGDGC